MIRIILFALMVSLFLSSSLMAQIDIRSFVKDKETREAIAGATVTLRAGNDSLKQATKGNGEFRFTIKLPLASLTIKALGYRDTTFLFMRSDSIIYLERDAKMQSEVIVTASRHISATQDVPISVSVVSAREILDRSPQTIDQALRAIPGVSVTEDQVSIRGSSGYARSVGSRVLFLLDGMPLLSADNGDIKFDAIPLIDIDRVEVVKGAGSALYGSNALGGIINVITRNPTQQTHGSIMVNGGEYDKPKYDSWKVAGLTGRYVNTEAGISTTIGETGVLASLAFRRNEGYRFGDDSYKYSGFLKTTHHIGDQNDLTLSLLGANDDHGGWLYWRSLSQPFMPSDSLSAVNERIHSSKINFNGSLRTLLSDATSLLTRGSIFYTHFTTDPLIPSDTNNPHSTGVNYNVDVQANSALTQSLFLTTGVTATLQTVRSDLFNSHNGLSVGGYAQAEFSIDEFIITGGIRFDDIKYQDVKGHAALSPKLGLTYKQSENLSFRTSLGSGFRAPSVTEQFTDQVLNGFTVKPNIGLIPEKSYSVEVGSTFRNDVFYLDGAIFYSAFNNLIEPLFVTGQGSPFIQFQNITKAEIYGLEEVVEVRPFANDDLALRVGYTYIYPHDKTTGKILNFRSRHLFQGHVDLRQWEVFFSSDFRYVSKFEAIDPLLANQITDGDARVDAYVLDARIGYDMKKATDIPLKVILQAQNLLNYYYVEIAGNMAPVRNISLKLETTF